MRVDFSFNKDLVEANGYTIEHIYDTIKREFAEKTLPV